MQVHVGHVTCCLFWFLMDAKRLWRCFWVPFQTLALVVNGQFMQHRSCNVYFKITELAERVLNEFWKKMKVYLIKSRCKW